MINFIRKKFFKKNINTNESCDKKKDSILYDIAWAFCAYLIISTFFYQNFFIPSGSMKPNLLEGDYIVVSKSSYGYSKYSLPLSLPLIKNRILDFKKPKRGDVIVFALPNEPSIKYVKRLIGLPGDELQIKNKILYINDKEIKREYKGIFVDRSDYLNKYIEYYEFLDEKKINIMQKEFNSDFLSKTCNTIKYKIPDGYYFFMGDNRENSQDSRFNQVGMVPYENIIGKAKIIFFSKNDSLLNIFNWGKSIRFGRIFNKIV